MSAIRPAFGRLTLCGKAAGYAFTIPRNPFALSLSKGVSQRAPFVFCAGAPRGSA